MNKVGYWTNHKYKRHSVERDIEYTGFIGWKAFNEILETTKSPRDRNLILTAFKIGGRINEVLNCEYSHFTVQKSPENNQDYLLCHMVPLSKRWRKIGTETLLDGTKKTLTEKLKAYRTFALPLKDMTEPYSQEFADFVLQRPKKQELLFPSPYKTKKNQPLTRIRAYQIVTEIGEKLNITLYTHYLRALRASQLKKERNFSADDLMEFFKWRDYKTALHYAKKGVWGLANKFM